MQLHILKCIKKTVKTNETFCYGYRRFRNQNKTKTSPKLFESENVDAPPFSQISILEI